MNITIQAVHFDADIKLKELIVKLGSILQRNSECRRFSQIGEFWPGKRQNS